MEARNQKLVDWYGKIKRGEIKLPRFQRFEAWDPSRIRSLLNVVIRNLPLGITLILEVGEQEKFVSRFLETAPAGTGRVYEHLLDGQQRLTALWRTFHNNYEFETYFVYLQEFDRYESDEQREDMSIYSRSRYYKKDKALYPLWCDNPAESFNRGMIPTNLLRPEDIQTEIDEWIENAVWPLEPRDGTRDDLVRFFEFKKRVSDRIKDLRAVVANYNLPYLSLPAHTDKAVALDVFINMNTNSKPLSTYDIIVAEVESITGESLHDLVSALNTTYPEVARYSELSDLILTTSSLLQGLLPNQRGAWEMDHHLLVNEWDTMTRGLTRMAAFLKGEGIYDRQRLPTNAVLAVLGALFTYIPEAGDKRGQDELLLKQYLWYSFFTDRYENSAATNAFADFAALRGIIRGDVRQDGMRYEMSDVPIFDKHSLVTADELLTVEWPKRTTIRGRGILAVASRLGALDFATGERLDITNIGTRQYHHIFPDALLKEAGVNSFVALNCALITDKTNISIGRKDPLKYLTDRYEWTSEEIVRERLQSHLIPIQELASGGYSDLDGREKAAKIRQDFNSFLRKRAELMQRAVSLLASGRQLNPGALYLEADRANQLVQ